MQDCSCPVLAKGPPAVAKGTGTTKIVAAQPEADAKETIDYAIDDAPVTDVLPEGPAPGSDGPEDGAVPDARETSGGGAKIASTLVTRAAGGELKLAGAILRVPPGTDASDKTITVTTFPAEGHVPEPERIIGDIFDLEPDGTAFSANFSRVAYLTLPLPRALAANEAARIGWFDERTAEWIPISSAVKGSTVTAAINHFTAFAVLIGSSTDNAAFCGFLACGGDPKGTWELVSNCDGGQEVPHAVCAAAGDATSWSRSYEEISGTLTLDPAKTLLRDYRARPGALELTTSACFDKLALAAKSYASCGAYEQERGVDAKYGEAISCAGGIADGCLCRPLSLGNVLNQTGVWSVSGNVLTIEGQESTPFCVEGNKLWLNSPASGILFFVRK